MGGTAWGDGRHPLCVAAVQWHTRPFDSLESLHSSLQAPLMEATQAGAMLVAFSDGVADALAGVMAAVASEALEGDALVRQRAACPALAGAFHELAGDLARANGVALAPGPVLVVSAQGMHRVSSIYGPDGRLLGSQVQTHRTAEERVSGLARGSEVAPIETPVGPVGLLNGADVQYPEVARILSLQGALILVHQGALPHFSQALALSRLWREVQANQVFGIEAYAVGNGYCGLSAIHAPVEITPGQTGWLARAGEARRGAVLTAGLDLAAREKLCHLYPILGLGNEGQYRRYFPAIYEMSRGVGANC